jgi:hypothetical protein
MRIKGFLSFIESVSESAIFSGSDVLELPNYKILKSFEITLVNTYHISLLTDVSVKYSGLSFHSRLYPNHTWEISLYDGRIMEKFGNVQTILEPSGPIETLEQLNDRFCDFFIILCLRGTILNREKAAKTIVDDILPVAKNQFHLMSELKKYYPLWKHIEKYFSESSAYAQAGDWGF